jgi:hypothetical protein
MPSPKSARLSPSCPFQNRQFLRNSPWQVTSDYTKRAKFYFEGARCSNARENTQVGRIQ